MQTLTLRSDKFFSLHDKQVRLLLVSQASDGDDVHEDIVVILQYMLVQQTTTDRYYYQQSCIAVLIHITVRYGLNAIQERRKRTGYTSSRN